MQRQTRSHSKRKVDTATVETVDDEDEQMTTPALYQSQVIQPALRNQQEHPQRVRENIDNNDRQCSHKKLKVEIPEDDRKPAAKKIRRLDEMKIDNEVDNDGGYGFNKLDDLSVNTIYSFLDVKSLYSIVFCSKYLMSALSHEHVIRSAMISGGHAKKTITELVSLIESESILIPSPLRLLRLTNGKYCERGVRNCCYSQAQYSETPKKVNHIRPGYGLFLCWECLTSLTCEIKKNHCTVQHSRVLPLRPHRRVAYILEKPYIDLTGERSGTLLSLSEYTKLEIENNLTPKKTRLRKKNEKNLEMINAIDEHLKVIDSKINVYKDMHQVIVNCFEDAKHDRKKLEENHEMEKKKRTDTALDNRVKKMKSIVEQLETFFVQCDNNDNTNASSVRISHTNINSNESFDVCADDDSSLLPSPSQLATIVFECIWWSDSTSLLQPRKNESCCRFRVRFVNERLRPYTKSPSKATKKALQELASQLRNDIYLIYTKRFYRLKFLSNDIKTDRFEYFVRKYHPVKDYSIKRLLDSYGIDEGFFYLLRQNKLFEALQKMPSAFHSVFSDAVTSGIHSDDSSSSSAITQKDIIIMAQSLWKSNNLENIQFQGFHYRETATNYEELKIKFNKCESFFMKLLPIAEGYVKYIEKNGYEEIAQNAENQFDEDIRRICCDIWSNGKALNLLQKRDFIGARKCAWETHITNGWVH